ncbi:hypothetical protein GXP67_10725 [Rhodocytophaga rosea]|uniref:Uncharacterized protein n=1 Tax=Rhodocytophaga rosea TaxID=2704465 RepID=A0A6C0GGG4_9BACT|nr:hypothetical protein [Rhodocytophaga rosea]QHT67088.1 hypothetical protein GXP67_10725 [Rhodocytophaga rosea]
MKHKKIKQLGIQSFYVVGGGLCIVILFVVFLINYGRYWNSDYNTLKRKYPIIREDYVYELMNTVFIESNSAITDSLELTKIICFAHVHSSTLREVIEAIEDSIASNQDRQYLLDQLDKTVYLWDNQRLNNNWLLTPNDLNQISRNDTTDYWQEYRKKFGTSGKLGFSKPVFNKSKQIAIVERSIRGDWLMGRGDIIICRKVNGQWKIIKEENLWIN